MEWSRGGSGRKPGGSSMKRRGCLICCLVDKDVVEGALGKVGDTEGE